METFEIRRTGKYCCNDSMFFRFEGFQVSNSLAELFENVYQSQVSQARL